MGNREKDPETVYFEVDHTPRQLHVLKAKPKQVQELQQEIVKANSVGVKRNPAWGKMLQKKEFSGVKDAVLKHASSYVLNGEVC